MRGLLVVAGVAGVLSATVAPRPCWARSGRVPSVGLVRPEAPAPVVGEVLLRVTGELRSAGLEPRIIEVGPGEAAACDAGDAQRARACLARLSADRGLDAVLSMGGEPVPDTVAVWAADRAAGRSVWRRMFVRPGVDHVAETLAIRAGELLRSCLVEIDLISRESGPTPEASGARPPTAPGRSGEPATPAAPRKGTTAAGAPPEPAAVAASARASAPDDHVAAGTTAGSSGATSPSRTVALTEATASEAAPFPRAAPGTWTAGVGAGAVAVMSFDGVGPAVLPEVRLTAALGPAWLVRLTAAGLGTSAAVGNGTDDASVTQDHVLAGVYHQLRPGRRLRPQLAVRAGALRTVADGHAGATNQGRRATQWSLLVDAGAGAAVSLGARADLVLAAHLQLAQPYPALRFVDQVVATTAHPGLLLTAALDVWP